MKKYLFGMLVAVFVTSCEKDPDLSKLSADFTVYTNYDSNVNFKDFKTYCLPDSILLIGKDMKAEYWKDDQAQQIIKEVANEMDTRGYTRAAKGVKDANIGIQLSFAQQTTQVIGGGGWYGGGWYNGWWSPDFWGPYWNDWYYPYPVSYSYDTGTMILEMVDLTPPASGKTKVKLPVIWHSYATGLLSNNNKYNLDLILRAVDQAFKQSSYIEKK